MKKKGILKDGILLGLRAAKESKAAIERVLKNFVNDGHIPKKEAGIILKRIISASKNEQKRISKLAKIELNKVLKEIGIVSVKEAKLLKRRLRSLENLVKKKGMGLAKKIRK